MWETISIKQIVAKTSLFHLTGGVIYNPTLSIFHSIVAVVVVDDRIGKQRDQIEWFLKGLCIKLSKKLVQIFTHFLGYFENHHF